MVTVCFGEAIDDIINTPTYNKILADSFTKTTGNVELEAKQSEAKQSKRSKERIPAACDRHADPGFP